MAIRTVPYVKDQPTSGWTTGFPWDDTKLKEKYNADLNNLTRFTTLARDLVEAYDTLDTVLGNVEANGYTERENLPPYPFPGELAGLKLKDLTAGSVFATMLKTFLDTPVAFPQFDETTGEAIADPPAVKPIAVLRRIAKSSK